VPLAGEYGGYNPWLEGADFLKLLQDAGSNPVDPTLAADLNTVLTDLSFPGNPARSRPLLGASAAAAPAAAVDPSSVDPTSFSADMSALLASLGTTAGADVLSQLTAEISAQLTADLAAFVPQSLLSMF